MDTDKTVRQCAYFAGICSTAPMDSIGKPSATAKPFTSLNQPSFLAGAGENGSVLTIDSPRMRRFDVELNGVDSKSIEAMQRRNPAEKIKWRRYQKRLTAADISVAIIAARLQ